MNDGEIKHAMTINQLVQRSYKDTVVPRLSGADEKRFPLVFITCASHTARRGVPSGISSLFVYHQDLMSPPLRSFMCDRPQIHEIMMTMAVF